MVIESEWGGLLILGLANATVAVVSAVRIARIVMRQRAAERVLRVRLALRRRDEAGAGA